MNGNSGGEEDETDDPAILDLWDGTIAGEPTAEGVQKTDDIPVENDNVYEIYTGRQLAWIGKRVDEGYNFSGKQIKLKKNLNLNGENMKNWTPIGVNKNLYSGFSGTFDGEGKTIKNIYISLDSEITTTTTIGLFSSNIGTISNLNIAGPYTVNVKGDNFTNYSFGTIVGTSLGTINNCSNKADIEFDENILGTVGGIVGGSVAIVNNCNNSGKIKASKYAGGIVGSATTLGTNNINSGNIEATDGYAGGIIGEMAFGKNITVSKEQFGGNCTVENCIITGKYAGVGVGFFQGDSSSAWCIDEFEKIIYNEENVTLVSTEDSYSKWIGNYKYLE